MPNNYGNHLGFDDEHYKKLGVSFLENEKEIINNADIIIQLGLPEDDKLSLLKENQTLVGSLNYFSNKEKLDDLKKKKYKLFFFRIITKNYKSTIYGYIVFSS